MKQIDELRDWYQTLAPRERKIVAVGGVALLLIVLWLAMIAPWLSASSSLHAQVQSDTRLLAWMRQAAAEVKQLEKATSSSPSNDRQSLFSTVEQTARGSSIGGHIKNFQPRGNDTVQIRLEGAPFDALVTWLGQLQAQHGVLASSLGVQQAQAPGAVNADITLEQPEK